MRRIPIEQMTVWELQEQAVKEVKALFEEATEENNLVMKDAMLNLLGAIEDCRGALRQEIAKVAQL